MRHAYIKGTGSYLPEKIYTNEDLEKMVDTSDEWITTRTGIKERHIASEDEATSDLAAKAIEKALENANVKKEDIDLIMIATVTPDHLFPSTAAVVQKHLNMTGIPALDISAACSGFIYGLQLINGLIAAGTVNNAILVGAETLTKITDWTDRSTCVLFGDGAGAVVVGATEDPNKGIISSYWGADGTLGDLLIQPAGGSRKPATEETVKNREHYIKMQGNTVFKHAVRMMGDGAVKVIEDAGLTNEDIDYLVPHQANIRIIESTAKRINLSMDKVFVNIDKIANTSSATIPIALDEMNRKGLLKDGTTIVIDAFGGGFTWGAMVIRW